MVGSEYVKRNDKSITCKVLDTIKIGFDDGFKCKIKDIEYKTEKIQNHLKRDFNDVWQPLIFVKIPCTCIGYANEYSIFLNESIIKIYQKGLTEIAYKLYCTDPMQKETILTIEDFIKTMRLFK